MALSAQIKRGQLRLAWEKFAPGNNIALREWMLAELVRLQIFLADGNLISSTAEAGGQVSFSTPTILSPADQFACWAECLDLYDAVASDLATADEATIYTEMIKRLAGVHCYSLRLTNLRV